MQREYRVYETFMSHDEFDLITFFQSNMKTFTNSDENNCKTSPSLDSQVNKYYKVVGG